LQFLSAFREKPDQRPVDVTESKEAEVVGSYGEILEGEVSGNKFQGFNVAKFSRRRGRPCRWNYSMLKSLELRNVETLKL
jgi:hypothetical protein